MVAGSICENLSILFNSIGAGDERIVAIYGNIAGEISTCSIGKQYVGNACIIPFYTEISFGLVGNQCDKCFPLVGVDGLATETGRAIAAALVNVDAEITLVNVIGIAIACYLDGPEFLTKCKVFAAVKCKLVYVPYSRI